MKYVKFNTEFFATHQSAITPGVTVDYVIFEEYMHTRVCTKYTR